MGTLVNLANVKTNVNARCDLTGLKLPTVIGLLRVDGKTKCDKPERDLDLKSIFNASVGTFIIVFRAVHLLLDGSC